MAEVACPHILEQKVAGSGDSSADHDCIGREHRRERRQAKSKPPASLGQCFQRERISCPARAYYFANGATRRSLRKGRRVDHGLKAPMRSTAAKPPFWIHDDMSEIARALASEAEQFSIDDYSATDSGAERDAK